MKKSSEAEIVDLNIAYLTDCIVTSRHQGDCPPRRLWKYNKKRADSGNLRKFGATYRLASFPGAEEGEERAPGTHCLRMRVIIANITW